MRVTRRFWLTAAAVGCLTIGGWLLGSSLLLVAAAGLTGWVLAIQVAFVRAVSALRSDLTVSQVVDRTRIRTKAETTYRLQVSVAHDRDHLPVTVRAALPLVANPATDEPMVVTLDRSTDEESATVPLLWQTVGDHTIPGATVTTTDTAGLFVQEFQTDPGPEITVESPAVDTVHVGQGGKRVMRGVGEHDGSGIKGGLSAEEIRKYVPGDALKHIDWKATARLDEAHVRDYEANSNRKTLLVLDHRSSMQAGSAGERKLDYLKAIAEAFRDHAEEIRDPLGYLTIDDTGVTGILSPVARASGYESCRHRISDLGAGDTERAADGPSLSLNAVSPQPVSGVSRSLSPTEETLLAYRDATGSNRRLPDQPLYNGMRATEREVGAADLVVLCTDDSNPGELRNVVGLARQKGSAVIVFITPSVAFSSDMLGDMESAYSQYQRFDRFRRDLNGMDGVTAYEVAPPETLQSILSTQQASRTRSGSA